MRSLGFGEVRLLMGATIAGTNKSLVHEVNDIKLNCNRKKIIERSNLLMNLLLSETDSIPMTF